MSKIEEYAAFLDGIHLFQEIDDDDDLFDLKHLVFEGYRAQGPGDVIFPPKETSIDNNKIEKLLKNQTFENKLDRIDDISSKHL